MATAINKREIIGAITPHNPAIFTITVCFEFGNIQTTSLNEDRRPSPFKNQSKLEFVFHLPNDL